MPVWKNNIQDETATDFHLLITCLIRHSGSKRDGSERAVGELRGSLVLNLAAGTHTVALQWKVDNAEGAVPWYALNGIGGFFQVKCCSAFPRAHCSGPQNDRLRNYVCRSQRRYH